MAYGPPLYYPPEDNFGTTVQLPTFQGNSGNSGFVGSNNSGYTNPYAQPTAPPNYAFQPRQSANHDNTGYTVSPPADFGYTQYGNSYGGYGSTYNAPMVGGYIQAPSLGGGNGAAQRQYQQAYEAARRANEQRYNQIGGFNQPGLGVQTRTATVKGKQVEQAFVGGQWVDKSTVTPEMLNSQVAGNSQYASLMGGYYGRYARGEDAYNKLGSVNDFYANRAKQGQDMLGAPLDAVQGRYDERVKQGMNMAGALGWQERNDINSRYDKQMRGNEQRLVDSGLTNSTVLSSVRDAAEADRGAALGALNDRMMANNLNAYTSLSGDSANFASRVPQMRAQNYGQLSGDQAQWMGQYGQLGLQQDANLSGDMLQFAERRSDPYPDPNAYYKSAQNSANYGALQRYYGGGF